MKVSHGPDLADGLWVEVTHATLVWLLKSVMTSAALFSFFLSLLLGQPDAEGTAEDPGDSGKSLGS